MKTNIYLSTHAQTVNLDCNWVSKAEQHFNQLINSFIHLPFVYESALLFNFKTIYNFVCLFIVGFPCTNRNAFQIGK